MNIVYKSYRAQKLDRDALAYAMKKMAYADLHEIRM